jgi:hypothetical protein
MATWKTRYRGVLLKSALSAKQLSQSSGLYRFEDGLISGILVDDAPGDWFAGAVESPFLHVTDFWTD